MLSGCRFSVLCLVVVTPSRQNYCLLQVLFCASQLWGELCLSGAYKNILCSTPGGASTTNQRSDSTQIQLGETASLELLRGARATCDPLPHCKVLLPPATLSHLHVLREGQSFPRPTPTHVLPGAVFPEKVQRRSLTFIQGTVTTFQQLAWS